MKKIFFLLATHSLLLTASPQKVGIGTTNPDFKLDVRNGSINTDSLYRIGAITVLAVPGAGNLFVGKEAGKINAGSINTFSGDQAGFVNAGGSFNSFFGGSAGMSNNNGNHNSFYGSSAGLFNAAGSFNSFFGSSAGSLNNGNQNTFIGRNAGSSNTTGSGNTALGFSADVSTGTPLTNATAIGANAFVSQDNSLVLGSISGVNGANSSTRVGIGTSSPLSPLEIKTTAGAVLRLDGGSSMYASFNENGIYRGYVGSYSGSPEDMDFGTGLGNTTGKMHLTIQTSPKLTVDASGDVGIGNTSPTYRLDVNGDMNITGALRIDGSAGTTGQVLISNGTGSPTWQNAALNNTVRFAVSLNSNSTPYYTSVYNYSPADVTIGSSDITINKSGLYHIEGYLTQSFVSSCAPSIGPTISCLLVIDGTDFWVATFSNLIRSNTHADYRYFQTFPFAYDFYITAPGNIHISTPGSFGAPCPGWTEANSGRITGYLISE